MVGLLLSDIYVGAAMPASEAGATGGVVRAFRQHASNEAAGAAAELLAMLCNVDASLAMEVAATRVGQDLEVLLRGQRAPPGTRSGRGAGDHDAAQL